MLLSDPHGPAFTLPAQLRDYPEWHRGRCRYGLWMILVEQPPLLEHIRQLQRQLADLLHPCGARQPHLTLFVCGFEQPRPRHDDDFTPHLLQAQLEALGSDAGAPCELPLRTADAFASAAILPVDDPENRLADWRATLARTSREIRQQHYLPHLTLGLFKQRIAADALRERLLELAPPPEPLQVSALHYASYEARDLFGALRSQRHINLR